MYILLLNNFNYFSTVMMWWSQFRELNVHEVCSSLYIENTRWVSFDIKFTRQGYENACWHREAWYSIYQFTHCFTLQTSDYEVLFCIFLSIQCHLPRISESEASSWPDKGTYSEIDNFYQAMCNNAVNMRGNWFRLLATLLPSLHHEGLKLIFFLYFTLLINMQILTSDWITSYICDNIYCDTMLESQRHYIIMWTNFFIDKWRISSLTNEDSYFIKFLLSEESDK